MNLIHLLYCSLPANAMNSKELIGRAPVPRLDHGSGRLPVLQPRGRRKIL